MKEKRKFELKEGSSVYFSENEVEEIVPDADMRFSLVILKNAEKHFVCGTLDEIKVILKG